ncbi:hypothetical protein PVAP13_9NG351014 [Panicum virgatum]|uniref:Uncharacterized protein n=1 Tax=Panicum virgatum TaxID=38727 RepID=A0A8T0MN57_PANVG|nr:hypothetical protein PVAP13_9NG351014 [Panicum virgatum]
MAYPDLYSFPSFRDGSTAFQVSSRAAAPSGILDAPSPQRNNGPQRVLQGGRETGTRVALPRGTSGAVRIAGVVSVLVGVGSSSSDTRAITSRPCRCSHSIAFA